MSLDARQLRELRWAIEAVRDDHRAQTIDVLDAVATMLVEDAVVAGVEAGEARGPGLARTLGHQATELHRLAERVREAVYRDRG